VVVSRPALHDVCRRDHLSASPSWSLQCPSAPERLWTLFQSGRCSPTAGLPNHCIPPLTRHTAAATASLSLKSTTSVATAAPLALAAAATACSLSLERPSRVRVTPGAAAAVARPAPRPLLAPVYRCVGGVVQECVGWVTVWLNTQSSKFATCRCTVTAVGDKIRVWIAHVLQPQQW
jgi:hypothetical protein